MKFCYTWREKERGRGRERGRRGKGRRGKIGGEGGRGRGRRIRDKWWCVYQYRRVKWERVRGLRKREKKGVGDVRVGDPRGK